MKKKALAAVLVAAVTMSMAGCGSKQAASTDGGENPACRHGMCLCTVQLDTER